jgi:hypothetical protein
MLAGFHQTVRRPASHETDYLPPTGESRAAVGDGRVGGNVGARKRIRGQVAFHGIVETNVTVLDQQLNGAPRHQLCVGEGTEDVIGRYRDARLPVAQPTKS